MVWSDSSPLHLTKLEHLPVDTALAVLLSSDHGAWITGQTIPVNGGYSFAL